MELALWPLTLETRCPFDILRSGSLSIGCSVPGEIYLFTDVATAMCPVNLHVICISLHLALTAAPPLLLFLAEYWATVYTVVSAY